MEGQCIAQGGIWCDALIASQDKFSVATVLVFVAIVALFVGKIVARIFTREEKDDELESD